MLSLSATCLPQLRRPPLLPCLVERVLLAQTRFRLHRLELQLVALELPSSQSRSGPFAIIQPRRWPHADCPAHLHVAGRDGDSFASAGALQPWALHQ